MDEYDGLTSFTTASSTLEEILNENTITLNQPLYVMGQSTLLYAASMYDEELALKIIKAKKRIPVNINAIDNHGYSALHYAADADMYQLVKTLLQCDDIDVMLKTEDLNVVGQIQSGGRTALHLAVIRGNLKLVKDLVEYEKKLVMVPDLDGNLPVHLGQLYSVNSDLIQYLLSIHNTKLYEESNLITLQKTQQLQANKRYQDSLKVPSNLYTPHTFPNVWTSAECNKILEQVLSKTSQTGWNTSRHTSYPTTDLPSYRLPFLDQWIQESLQIRLFPKIIDEFQLHPSTVLSFRDLFYVKYEAAGPHVQNDLALHCDGSILSFNILLNRKEEFEGGGTFFAPTKTTIHIQQGDALVHSGRVVHGAASVVSGKRLIIVAFLNVRPSPPL
ncbi:hypothetical protein THRCLA_04957 [Thraustotheca clavata]|uniref:Fe2OG dioxygenase domain-containing protein n=1 Tax=Thraustotheca clavata TaxID=74557 RepID=A0A1V9ZY10_9STRA|nr:hypothetical protein THRCLA_04957 [Thraustotheca clavata]